MTQHIKLMADYGTSPLWRTDPSDPDNIEPAALPLSDETRAPLTMGRGVRRNARPRRPRDRGLPEHRGRGGLGAGGSGAVETGARRARPRV